MNTQDMAARYWAINDRCKAELVERGGLTIDTFEPEWNLASGYVTSDPKFGRATTLEEFLSPKQHMVFSFLVDHTHELDKENRYFGIWLDTADNTVFLDVNLVCSSKEQALEFAEMNGERAIWDLKNNSPIYVNQAV